MGLSLLANSEACIENLERFGVRYREYTWDEVQMRGGSQRAMREISEEIVKEVKERYGEGQPVIFTIDGDTVCGLPCSASNEVLGYPPEDVYPMISFFAKELNLVSLSIQELKPSLDPSKNLAVGEFLANSLFLFTQTLLKSKKL